MTHWSQKRSRSSKYCNDTVEPFSSNHPKTHANLPWKGRSLVMDRFTWKYQGKGFGKDFIKSGFIKRGLVIGGSTVRRNERIKFIISRLWALKMWHGFARRKELCVGSVIIPKRSFLFISLITREAKSVRLKTFVLSITGSIHAETNNGNWL